MSIEQKYIELINAEVDGEISAEERASLEAFLAESAEGRAYRDELRALGAELSSLEALDPPPDLSQSVLARLRPAAIPAKGKHGIAEMLAGLFNIPALRYGVSFATGVLVTVSLMSTNEMSRGAFDDVTGLVGTISGSVDPGEITSRDRLQVNLNELAGSVSLSSAGSMMILDFDLASNEPVEIVATFNSRDIWFNGFAQLESQGTTVAAASGQVTVRMEGQRRYALYLQNTGTSEANVKLRFVADGETLHEGQLNFVESE